jgi:hypothetical protein
MAKSTDEKKGPASQLLGSLRQQIRCDSAEGEGLTPEQIAALHAFVHDVLRSYHHLKTLVPEEKVLAVLDRRFGKAIHDQPKQKR